MKRLYINPITRTIEPKHRSLKTVHISRGDHNSALLRFEIPQNVDGFNMSEATIQIHYANFSGDGLNTSKGMSDAIEVVANDDTVTFAWKIPKTATRYAGVLSIGVTFERYDNDDNKAEEIYSWSTAPYGEIVVCDSYDNSAEVTEREHDYLVETCNAIVLASLEENLKSIYESALNEATEDATDEAEGYMEEASVYAMQSKSYAIGGSNIREGEDADNAKYYSETAKSWAVGDTGTREGEDTDNAKHYCDEALEYHNEVKDWHQSVETAKTDVLSAKDVVQTAESGVKTAKTYVENASKQIANDVNLVSNNVVSSQENAEISGRFSEEAKGFRDEAKTFMEQASGHSGKAGDYVRECETVYNKLLKALQSQVSGTGVVRLEDVNSGMPTVKVECSSSVTVTMYGKNLDPYNPDRANQNTDTIKNNWDLTASDTSAWYTLNVPCDVTLTVFRTAVVGIVLLYEYDADGKQVGDYKTLFNTNSDTKKTTKIVKEEGHTYKLKSTKTAVSLMAKDSNADSSKYFDFWLQVEVGSASEYEGYKEPKTLTNLDNSEIYSPTATLITSPDAPITATYTKDINRTIERLENAIANS